METETKKQIAKNTINILKEEQIKNSNKIKELKRKKPITKKIEALISVEERYRNNLKEMLSDAKADLFVLRTIRGVKNGTQKNSKENTDNTNSRR